MCPSPSIRTGLVLFFCVHLCSLTLIHPSAPTHTHPHPTVSLIVPPCLPYLTHVIRVSPHPYLCHACPPSPTRASPCPLHVSDRAPTHHCIHPHPITPIYDPFLYVYSPYIIPHPPPCILSGLIMCTTHIDSE